MVKPSNKNGIYVLNVKKVQNRLLKRDIMTAGPKRVKTAYLEAHFFHMILHCSPKFRL